MTADIQRSTAHKTLRYDDPLVITTGALALGYVIGSGRWSWLGEEVAKIAKTLGSLALNQLRDSVEEHNPQLFGDRSRITH